MRKFKTESKRVESMLELAGVFDQNADSLQKMFVQIGLERSIEKLNSTHDTNLRLGDYIIQSKQEEGFWSNDFGWCFNKDGATGYSEVDLESYRQTDGTTKPEFFGVNDAEFVLYKEASDFKN
jgi:hypothetical protein